MGKILPFRRRRPRWTRTRDYKRSGGAPKFWPEERVTFRGLVRDTIGWLGVLRPFILGGILLSVWPALDPALVEPPAFLSASPERVNQRFTRCGPGRGHACVIDGDTIKIGERKVRIIGIDTPETHPSRCPEEARLGEAATAQLQRLLNQGPFEMTGRSFNNHDRYGRDLRTITRRRKDGSVQSIAEDMRDSGYARRYLGELKTGWC